MIIVYLIGFFHLIGAWMLQLGPWLLPQKYLWIYLIYGVINIISYKFIFNNKCFMTLLSNYYSNKRGTPLNIRMYTAICGLLFNIILSLLGIYRKVLAPRNLLRNFFIMLANSLK